MEKSKITLSMLLGMSLLTSTCHAATYYFSTSGNNTTGNGSLNSPFYSLCGPWPNAGCATGESKISLGQLAVNPGDQLLFKRGDEWVGLNAEWHVNVKGNVNDPITFGAYGDPNAPRPVFRGAKTAYDLGKDNWTNVPGTPIWYTSGISWWPNIAAQEENAPMGPSLFGAWSVQGVTNINGWNANQSMVRGTHFYDGATQRLYVWRTDDLKPDHNAGRDIYIGQGPHDGTNRLVKVNRGWANGSADPKFVGGNYLFQDLHVRLSGGYGFSTSYPNTRYVNCLSELNGMEGFLFDASRFSAPAPGAKGSSMKSCVSRRNNLKQGEGIGQGVTVEAENVVIEDSESYENAWAGIDFLDYNNLTKTNGGKIINTKVHNNGIHPVSAHNFDPNIYIDGGSDILIQNCEVWGAGVDPRGIKTRLRPNPGISISVEGNGYAVGKRPNNIKIINTLSYGNAGQAINIAAPNTGNSISNVHIIGNTLHRSRGDSDLKDYYDPNSSDMSVRLFGFNNISAGLVFKNNILLAYNTSRAPLFGSKTLIDQGKTAADFNNNIYYAPGTNFNVNGGYTSGGFFTVSYPYFSQNLTLDQWRNLADVSSKRRDEALSKAVIMSDPFLVDLTPASFDGRLQLNSSAIDAADAGAFPALTIPLAGTTRADGLADEPYNDLGFHYPTASGAALPPVTDSLAPTAPLQLAATTTGTQALLSWTSSTDDVGVVGYQVFDGPVQVGNCPSTSFSYNATAPKTCAFSVKAFDAANNISTPSNTLTLTVGVVSQDTSAPTTPLNLTGALNGTQVALSWQASTDNVGVLGYQIMNNGSPIATSAAASFTHNANAGTIYNYAVQAYDAAGHYSALSNLMTVTVPAAEPDAPTPPSNLAADLVGTQVQLSWDPATNHDGYNVYRNGTYMKTVWTTSSFDNSALAGNTYDYAVESYNYYDVRSAKSNTATVTIPGNNLDTLPPSVPANVNAVILTGSIAVSWDPSTDNVAVTTYRVLNNGVQIASVTSTTHTIISPTSGTTYNFTVRACDVALNCSASSSVETVVVPDFQAPSAPTGLQGTVSGTQVLLSWNASTDNIGVTGYQVLQAGTLLSTTMTTSAAFGPGVSGESYSFTVKAIDAANNLSGASNAITVSFVDAIPPSAPLNLTGSLTGSTAVLNWNPSTDNVGVTDYKIFEGATVVGTATSTTHTLNNLATGSGHTYIVKALDEVGNVSSPSNPLTVGVSGPAAPKNLIAYSAGSSIYVGWSSSTNAAGYAVYRNNVLLKKITSASLYDSSITAGTVYTYKVQAYDAQGNYSGFSNSMTVTTPALNAPAYLKGSRNGDKISLNWGSVSGASGYNIYRNGSYLRSMGTTSTTDTVSNGQTTKYTIKAYNYTGLQSAASNQITV